MWNSFPEFSERGRICKSFSNFTALLLSFCCFCVVFKNIAAYFLRSFGSFLPHFYVDPLFPLRPLSLFYSISIMFPEICPLCSAGPGVEIWLVSFKHSCTPPDSLYSPAFGVSKLFPVSAVILRLNLEVSSEHLLASVRFSELSMPHSFPLVSTMCCWRHPALVVFLNDSYFGVHEDTCFVIDVVHGFWFYAGIGKIQKWIISHLPDTCDNQMEALSSHRLCLVGTSWQNREWNVQIGWRRPPVDTKSVPERKKGKEPPKATSFYLQCNMCQIYIFSFLFPCVCVRARYVGGSFHVHYFIQLI